jgi:hypothetical protein
VTTSCFPAGTLITVPGGSKNIEDIQIGDTVLAYDINATGTLTFPGVLVEKTVTKTFIHTWAQSGSVSPLIIIKHEHGTLTTTTNHEILTPSKQTPGLDQGAELGFAMASMLEVGDIIYTADGVESKILEITAGAPYDLVYNFEVSDVHTYIADGVRVHNGSPPTKGTSTTTYAGGGGGGGAGIANGAAGAGGGGANNNGAAGSAGSNSAGGAGGSNGGGTGGGLGAAGTAGTSTNAGAAGAAGYYIVGNGSITWVATGTTAGQVG